RDFHVTGVQTCALPISVVARVEPGVPLDPQPGEVAEAFEVPLAFLLDPANCERVAVQYRGRMRHYFQFRHGGHRIWGATAAMLEIGGAACTEWRGCCVG